MDDPIIRVQDTADDVEQLARKIVGIYWARNNGSVIRMSDSPMVVEVVLEEPPRTRRRRQRHQENQAPLNAETVREAEEIWRQRLEAVKRMEERSQEDSVKGLQHLIQLTREQIDSTRRILSERFGFGFEGGDVFQKMRLVPGEAHYDLEDAEEMSALGDNMWRFMVFGDVRVQINRAFVTASQQGGDKEQAARAACDACFYVLRTRPVLYGIFASTPPWQADQAPYGLESIRLSAIALLAGWMKAQLKLRNWEVQKRDPEDKDKIHTKSGINRLRMALVDMAEEGERATDVLDRVLCSTTLAEWDRLINEFREDAERAPRKLVLREPGWTSLRNLVEKHIWREGGQKHELKVTGGLADPVEIADATREEEEFVMREGAREEIRGVLVEAKLSEREREVFLLRHLKSMTTHEIAHHLGIKEKTVYEYDRRANEKLKLWRERYRPSA